MRAARYASCVLRGDRGMTIRARFSQWTPDSLCDAYNVHLPWSMQRAPGIYRLGGFLQWIPDLFRAVLPDPDHGDRRRRGDYAWYAARHVEHVPSRSLQSVWWP